MSAFILALARIRNFGVMFLLAFAPVLPALAQQDNGVVTCPPPQPGFYFLRSTIPVGQACTDFQALQNTAGFCIYNRDESLGGGTTALAGTCEPAPASDPDPDPLAPGYTSVTVGEQLPNSIVALPVMMVVPVIGFLVLAVAFASKVFKFFLALLV